MWVKVLNKIKNLSSSEFEKNSIIVFGLKLLGVLLFFLLTIFITNNFPADYVGRYDFARSLLLIIGGINLLGFEQSIIYYSGKLRADNNFEIFRGIYKKMLVVIFVVYLFLFSVVWAIPNSYINYFFHENVYEVLVKVVGMLFFHSILMLNIEFIRGEGRLIVSESIRNIGRYLGFFILAFILLENNYTKWLAEIFLLNYIILGIGTTIYLYLNFFRDFKLKSIKQSNNEFSIKKIIGVSYPMALSTMTFFLLQNTDIVLLGKYVSYTYMAYYSVSVKVATLTSIVMMAISTVVAPKLSEWYAAKEMGKLRHLMRKSAMLIFSLSIPIFVFLLVFSSDILAFFGEEYVYALNSLYILIGGQLINAFSGPTGTYLNMTGRQKILQYILLMAFILNIVLNIILIPLYGIEGAAMATAGTTLIWNLVAVVYIYIKDKVKIFLHV